MQLNLIQITRKYLLQIMRSYIIDFTLVLVRVPGTLIDPAVSVPREKSENPPATALPQPVLVPPGKRLGST